MRRFGLALFIGIGLLAAFHAEALELNLAPLALVADGIRWESILPEADPQRDLLRTLQAEDTLGAISLIPPASGETPPVSYLEAALLCRRRGAEFLLYGYLKLSGEWVQGEVKLYDAAAGVIVASFFAMDTVDHYPRLVADIGRKILTFFYADYGLLPPAPPPSYDLLVPEIFFTIGPWMATGEQSGSSTVGLVRTEGGVAVTLKRPLPVELQPGVSLFYAAGLNRPEVEPFVLHSWGINLPVTLLVRRSPRSQIFLGAAPGVEFDYLQQERNYSGSYVSLSSAFSGRAWAGYRYRAGSSLSLGIEAGVERIFYGEPLNRLVLALAIAWELPGLRSFFRGGISE